MTTARLDRLFVCWDWPRSPCTTWVVVYGSLAIGYLLFFRGIAFWRNINLCAVLLTIFVILRLAAPELLQSQVLWTKFYLIQDSSIFELLYGYGRQLFEHLCRLFYLGPKWKTPGFWILLTVYTWLALTSLGAMSVKIRRRVILFGALLFPLLFIDIVTPSSAYPGFLQKRMLVPFAALLTGLLVHGLLTVYHKKETARGTVRSDSEISDTADFITTQQQGRFHQGHFMPKLQKSLIVFILLLLILLQIRLLPVRKNA